MKHCDTIRRLVFSTAVVLLGAACPVQEEGSSREDSGGHKTGDGITGEAPGVRVYAALGEECCGEDWSRADSYYFPDEPGESAATASEFVIRGENGQITSVMDQDFGIGLMVLEASN